MINDDPAVVLSSLFLSLSLSLSPTLSLSLSLSLDGCGYLEDRRPSSNCDPYTVAEAIVRSTVTGWDDFDTSRLGQ